MTKEYYEREIININEEDITVNVIDIGADNEWPSDALSNFAPHNFMIDGVECASMEGFLQSLKFSDTEKQLAVCELAGKEAKFAGKKKKWWKDQTLYWQGNSIDRHSEEYQLLLNRAFSELAAHPDFQEALLATGNMSLIHSIGKADSFRTILTEEEFTSRLTIIREILQENQNSISNQEH